MWTLAAFLVLGGGAEPADWQKQETTYLKNIRRITTDFVRAGEGYFSPDGTKIIFQAEQKGENPFYQQFVMDLKTNATRRVSPGIGKTTCGYFSPDGAKIIFASSHLDPDAKKHYAPEQQLRDEERKSHKRRRYVWDFDPFMEIFETNLDGSALKRLTNSPGYDAEGSYSPDGKQIVFCSNRSGKENLELHIMSADGSQVRQLTHAPGCYNGGPFFSPDGKRVIFRSDRKKKDHLQLYVINVDGTDERALTDDPDWIFWAPFWYTDSRHIVYTAADHSDPTKRPNYDLYWADADQLAKAVKQNAEADLRRSTFAMNSGSPRGSIGSSGIPHQFRTAALVPPKTVRLTFHPGADVLPVFSPDYRKVMWTSTRGEDRSSQLWIADFTPPDE